MSKYWSDVVHKLTPYIPGEQPRGNLSLKLNTNENPYGPSQNVIDSISAANNDQLRLYPDPESDLLKSTISNYYNIPMSSIFLGNGSDEILAFIFQGFFKNKLPILLPEITYSFYPAYWSLYDIKYQDSVIVIDEAYVDFGTESAIELVNQYKNLVITQSFSKSRSLAGMRLGCAFGNEDLIEALNRIKNSFNSYPIDRLAQVAGIEAIKDENYFNETRDKIIQARIFLENELLLMGFETLPSGANFIFTKHRSKDAVMIFKKLRESGVIVRHFNEPERISHYLRITIGTQDEMRNFISILKAII